MVTLISRLLSLPPLTRRLVLVASDAILIPLAVWLSFALRLAQPWPAQLQDCLWLFPVAWVVTLGIYGFTGQYKGVTRYAGSRVLYALALRNLAAVLVLQGLSLWPPLVAPPRSSWLLLWLLLTGFTGLLRFVLRDLLQLMASARRVRQVAVIYGAGAAGMQLASALRYAGSHRVAAFLDDDPRLWGRHLNGVAVLAPARLPALLRQHSVSQILLALPSVSRGRRRRIVADLQPFGIPVLQVPSMGEITGGRTRIDELRPVAIEELLGRDPVAPITDLLRATVTGRCVLVTGAGGSIGSELCRQILNLAPSRLVLLERSEPSLYAIDQELGRHAHAERVVPALGCAGDRSLLDRLLGNHGVQTVFHAAAYKHVPMVEANPQAAIENNVFVTRRLMEACRDHRVERVMLISTDKAVRPTSVMGATKRVAELIVQAMAQQPGDTVFSLVRFGNVLGSSGSVVPLFRRQIDEGGPITVTHPEVIRYFMTIPEAVQLVLQACAMARGGDCFLLDMGEPVKIFDLARQMVTLSGLSVCDADHPDGDIEIRCVGLRPGEKLYEELLIAAASEPTQHPLVYRAHESCLPPAELWHQLEAIERARSVGQETRLVMEIAHLVPECNLKV